LAQQVATVRGAPEGERKQVTVLFCDIANSTALAERIGAEAMHALLNRFFELALEELHRYECEINQFGGDGFMALAPSRMRTMLDAPCLRLSASSKPCARAERAWEKVAAGLPCGSGSTPVRSSWARSATACAWTTPLSAIRPT
jgi:class 3 adenylate cyclase